MIKERYVNFEVANLLKDKGFDEPCDNYYDQSLDEPQQLTLDEMYYSYDEFIKAPTQAMACDWVEETFNISIVLDLTILGYEPFFLNGHKNPNTASTAFLSGKDYIPIPIGDNSDGSWSSKELAYNEALKYVLTNLI